MRKSIISFIVAIFVIALLCLTVVYGLDLGFVQIPSITDTEDGVRLGLDLVGGSIVTFEAQLEEGASEESLSSDMERAKSMLQNRLDDLGLFEAPLYKVGDRRITVEMPSVSDPEEAVQMLGSTAKLEFKDADGNVIVDGSEVVDSSAESAPLEQNGPTKNFITVKFSPEAAAKFTAGTKAVANRPGDDNYIVIEMDGKELSRPYVDKAKFAATGITGDSVIIEGSFTPKSAGRLANLIAAGQLPFALKQVEMRSVGPQLGLKALSTSIKAGIIGICLIIIFMLVFYRLPGLIAAIALVFYVAIVCIILSVTRLNLSLPGIAGIILSIGMAVDANVVIFERIKEELRTGKTLKSAIDSGFHRAFTAILDSNITTMIAAIVLYFMGTGTIVGFALTLGIGIVVSMFTALTVTHFLLNQLVGMKVTNLALYGVKVRRDA